MAPQEFGVRVGLDERVEREHVHGRLEVPQPRWAVPLQQPQHPPVIAVGLAHVAVHHPRQVRRHADDAVEVEGTEAHAHQVLALGRGRRLGVVHRLHQREHVVDHLQAGLGLRDPRIGVLGGGLRRRRGRSRFPHPQRPELRVGRHQLAQRGGPGAR